jgi:predicted Zn-dependent protease
MQTIVVPIDGGKVAVCEVKLVLSPEEAKDLGSVLKQLTDPPEEPKKK